MLSDSDPIDARKIRKNNKHAIFRYLGGIIILLQWTEPTSNQPDSQPDFESPFSYDNRQTIPLNLFNIGIQFDTFGSLMLMIVATSYPKVEGEKSLSGGPVDHKC